MIKDAALCGTPDEVLEQAAEWRDCGVRYMTVANMSLLQRSARKAAKSALSFGRIVHGLKKF